MLSAVITSKICILSNLSEKESSHEGTGLERHPCLEPRSILRHTYGKALTRREHSSQPYTPLYSWLSTHTYCVCIELNEICFSIGATIRASTLRNTQETAYQLWSAQRDRLAAIFLNQTFELDKCLGFLCKIDIVTLIVPWCDINFCL